MEDLVEAEHTRPGVWPLQRIDDCTKRVEQTSAEDQAETDAAEVVQQLRERDGGRPTDDDVYSGEERPRDLDRQPFQRHADDCTTPCGAENHDLLPSIESHSHDRRIRAGDRQKDRRMVEPSHDRATAILPAQTVVQRRNSEHRQRPDDVDDQPDPLADRCSGNRRHDDAKHGDDSEGQHMRPSTQQWLEHHGIHGPESIDAPPDTFVVCVLLGRCLRQVHGRTQRRFTSIPRQNV